MNNALVLWFHEVTKEDVGIAGGKGANLGEMTRAGFPVPPGFIVTASAYYRFLEENHLAGVIQDILKGVRFEEQSSLEQVSERIKKLILQGTMSEQLSHAITSAYDALGEHQDVLVAVRSSATAEDLPTASFAGQQETYLNVQGKEQVLQKVKQAWASLFDARAIFYRHENHFDHLRVGIAVPVERMIESEASGVMFTVDPVTNDRSKIVIEAIYGLGELIVQGEVTPDHYEVDKATLAILTKTIAPQTVKFVKQGTENKEVPVAPGEQHAQKISDETILSLAQLGKQLEEHYHFPQDSEWAVEQGRVYLVQTRPVTTLHEKEQAAAQQPVALETLPLLVVGDPASPGIASGPVRLLHSAEEIEKVRAGEVLVAPQTNPDYVPAMKKAVAVVTDMGGRTSHAAIVSREIGIPAVVGTARATTTLADGMIVTVDGTHGKVYQGTYSGPATAATSPTELLHTRTKVYVNLAEPEFAERIAKRHVDGVGLLRAEFMMATIGKHPRQFIQEGKQDLFVAQLAEGLEAFCRAFAPRPVVYRTSDFKTNEYRDLVGGDAFEPEEPNPMLGFRGAFRYIKDEAVFRLELEAIKRVRNEQGLTNLWLMLPFVRTVAELAAVKRIVTASGLVQSDIFKLWMMVEIPSNVVLLDAFIDVGIDGVSIGSNDLTMLMLGTDRDNSLVAEEFNEQNEAVLWALERVITTAKARKITSSLCGQAASQYPDLVKKLIGWGITSVSVSPDAIDSTRKLIAEIEKR
ncbi:MAG TPA: phosphoenolpyruvate synthase [Ktedonobacteraceae bacterium]|nr:phosphoenolpyruvate synthase [Ktedonobacteraceae bacterium]